MRRLLLLGVALLVLASGCGSDGDLDREGFYAILVGAEESLEPFEADALDRVADRNTAFAGSLDRFWSGLSDPEVPALQWLELSALEINLMVDLSNDFTADVGELSNPALLRSLRPLADRWVEVIGAITAVRAAVEAGDDTAAQAATDDYNNALAAIAELDQAQVDRAVAAIGPDATREQLVARGVNPARYGL